MRLGVDRLAVPFRRFKDEADAGVGGARMALVDAKHQAHGFRGEGDADLFFRLADGGVQDVLAVFEVPARQSMPVA